MFLGRHHEVVSFALVVDDILKVDVRLSVEVAEELLVEDERDSADLLDTRLLVAVVVDEVGGDGDRKLTSELLPSETCINDNRVISCRSTGAIIVLHNASFWKIDTHPPLVTLITLNPTPS